MARGVCTRTGGEKERGKSVQNWGGGGVSLHHGRGASICRGLPKAVSAFVVASNKWRYWGGFKKHPCIWAARGHSIRRPQPRQVLSYAPAAAESLCELRHRQGLQPCRAVAAFRWGWWPGLKIQPRYWSEEGRPILKPAPLPCQAAEIRHFVLKPVFAGPALDDAPQKGLTFVSLLSYFWPAIERKLQKKYFDVFSASSYPPPPAMVAQKDQHMFGCPTMEQKRGLGNGAP